MRKSTVPLIVPVTQTRREFCSSVCRMASLVAAGTLVGCGNDSSPSDIDSLPSVASSVSGRVVTVIIPGSALATVGSAAVTGTSLGDFLIARTAQDAFVALTAICTHQGCTITGFENGRYVCPCHGSQFTTAGAVANGPASRPLQQFPTQFAADVLTFTV